ncbi:hypothetical protein AeMF1_005257 [Aphanomyces euteiches]|nr:hypothetical protein AeMF1_005257 [Aphanomyces euteiches]
MQIRIIRMAGYALWPLPQFERLMEDVLRDQLWKSCLVYLDDVIVFRQDSTHISRLREVLSCLQAAGFKLKMSKCKWGKTSVAFLGHIVTPAGILPNPEKVKSVLKIRPLRNVAEVRAFLGLAGYFRRFIKGFAAISRPLEKLKTAEVFQWTHECDEALNILKRKLVSPPILAYPDFDKPFFILVDACPVAVGAVLMQRQDNRDRVIAYASQALDATQQKWIHKKDGISEIECYGIVWATKKFRPYIDRRPFTIYTDHSALVCKMGGSSAKPRFRRRSPTRLQMGCADGLSGLPTEASLELIQTSDSYCYDGQYEEWVLQDTVFMAATIASNQNNPVDPTERNPGFPTPTRIDSNPVTSDPDSQNPAVPPIPDPGTDLPSPEGGSYDTQSDRQVTSIPVDTLPKYTAVTYRLPSKLLRDEQAKDLFIQAVKGYIEEKAIPTDPEVLQILIRTGKHFTMDKKILYRRTILRSPLRNPTVTKVPVIPVSMILTVLELCHDSSLSGHFGITRTIDRVKRIGYWKGWRDDVIDYCRKCLRCGAAKGTRPWKNGLMQRMPVYKLRGPFSFLVVDALGPFPLTPTRKSIRLDIRGLFHEVARSIRSPGYEDIHVHPDPGRQNRVPVWSPGSPPVRSRNQLRV